MQPEGGKSKMSHPGNTPKAFTGEDGSPEKHRSDSLTTGKTGQLVEVYHKCGSVSRGQLQHGADGIVLEMPSALMLLAIGEFERIPPTKTIIVPADEISKVEYVEKHRWRRGEEEDWLLSALSSAYNHMNLIAHDDGSPEKHRSDSLTTGKTGQLIEVYHKCGSMSRGQLQHGADGIVLEMPFAYLKRVTGEIERIPPIKTVFVPTDEVLEVVYVEKHRWLMGGGDLLPEFVDAVFSTRGLDTQKLYGAKIIPSVQDYVPRDLGNLEIERMTREARQPTNVANDVPLDIPTHRYGPGSFDIHGLPNLYLGTVVGLLGGKSTGKTTCLKILAGQLKPNLGRFEDPPEWDEIIDHFDTEHIRTYLTRLQTNTLNVALKSQDLTVYRSSLTVRTSLEESKGTGFDSMEELIEDLDMTSMLDTCVTDLSDAELQRFAIASTIVQMADVYLFDEPTIFLDARQKYQVARVILSVVKPDRYVCITDNDMSVLDLVCDHILYTGEETTSGEVHLDHYPLTLEELSEEIVTPPTYRYPETVVKGFGTFSLHVMGGDLRSSEITEIPNGHIRPNFADPLAKIGYGINSSHPGFKSPSSLYFEGSPQPLAQPSPKPLHKSTLDKLKNFRKNFSAKQRTSDRSEDVTKSSTSKADVSGPGSSESYQSSSSSSGHSSKDGNHDLSKKSSEDSTRKIETISDSDSNPSPSKNTPSTPEKTTLTGSSFGSPKTFNDTFASFVQQKASENQQYQHNVAHCSDDSPIKSIKKKRKVVINDDSSEEEEEEPIEKPKKKRRVVQESVSDSDEESSKKSKKKAKKQKQIIERDSETEEEMTDSDEYVPEELTSTMKIMSFLSESPLNDLKQVPSMTQRKIDIITAKRPFNDWFELVTHLRENSIPLGLLENVSDLLRAREAFSSLIKRVSKISEKTQLTIKSNEGKMTKQPLLLSPELQLSDYQVIGVNWLAVLHSLEMGGILADEMGLGKTVQVISFLAYLKEQKLVEHPHLIVVPSSTLANWENEFRRWCPSIGFQVYHGTLEERREMRYFWNKEGFGDTEVILSTYNCVGNNPEDSKFTKTAKFHYVVFDEAHMLKNMNTQRYSRLFLINAKNRLLLTGTPLQNNLLELMSLLNFTMPQVFRQNMESVKFILGKSTKPITEDSPDFEKEKVDQVKKIMEPFVLRRLKRNVLKHLPRKDVSVIKCTMVPEQASKYNELLAEFKQTEKFENLYMTMITSLRKMANHPLLLRYHYDDGKVGEMAECLALDPDYKDTNVEYIVQDLVFMSDYELHQLSDNFKCLRYDRFKLPESLFLESGKFRKFDEVLPNLKREGHRVLIFSQFLMVLDLIEKYLTANDHTYKRLDGSTPVVERQELIDTFNKDPSIFCFLLSTRAGGLGINLTAADTVIIHDIDINPYNDKQAEDRCHRVGQTRPVTVLKLISEDTLEEDLYKVTEAKLNLEQEVTGEVDEAAEKETFAVLLRRALGLEQNTAENKS